MVLPSIVAGARGKACREMLAGDIPRLQKFVLIGEKISCRVSNAA
jgi:hypothetical protein